MAPRKLGRYAVFLGLASLLWLVWPLRNKSSRPERAFDWQQGALHPIHQLFEDAKRKQSLTLMQQSQNVEEARSEYLRRYEINPPDGFDSWFNFAKKHRSPIIDDFDDMMASLRPFRAYQSSKCDYEHMHQKHPALMTVCVKNGVVELGNPNPSPYDKKQIVTPLLDFVSDFVGVLPDMCFYLNTYDEPRQVLLPETQASLLEETEIDSCEDHDFRHTKRRNVWTDFIKSCPEDSPAILGYQTDVQPKKAFVSSWSDATNLCTHTNAPASGIFRCPDTSSLTSVPRPILSAAKLSTFSDILFPTLWRWRFNIDSPKSIAWATLDDTTPWSAKKANLGWRGSSTGGYADGNNWKKFQRHQMVLMANSTGLDAGKWASELSIQNPRQFYNRLDVRFTSITGCEEKTCESMHAEIATAPSQTLTETFQNKIVLDMDGHGLSGRFYMLLQSHSAVMKQGLVREWHDSRLLPWLHYIPLSMEMGELEETLSFFFSSAEGDKVLQSIAEEGRKWVREALRKEDMRVYMYRLMLELGRRTF